jgi:CxxC-x17-CxxC domain-containing protein
MSTFTDRYLTCQDCSKEFIFTAGEQEFFSTKGLKNEPKRCPNCRVSARMTRAGMDGSQAVTVDCADCGAKTRVPFQPRGHKPVYCARCLHTRKRSDDIQETEGISEAAVELADD